VTNNAACPFCHIVDKVGSDAREVYRDDHVVAFFPLKPATLGHTLVVPRSHVTDIWALDPDTAAYLARVVVAVAGAVRRSIQPHGLNVIQSNGQAAMQTVMHLHVHLVPRWEGDPIGHIWPPEASYTEEQENEAWAALRTECRSMDVSG
jgi:histidine triad (HIT) family protein